MNKILVTGAAGFIGYHVSKALLERGEVVVGLDNLNDYYDVNLKISRLNDLGIKKKEIENHKIIQSKTYPHFKFIKMNLEHADGLIGLCKDWEFDFIINLAAQGGVRYSLINPPIYIQSNIVGFANILEAARNTNVKHLVYASSSSVYGLNEKMPFSTSDNVDHPLSLYAATKKANELMAHTYSHLYRIPTTGLRFFTVYGPWGRPDMAYFLFAEAISTNKPIKVFNKGKMKRDFTYIDDIVDGIIASMYKPAQPGGHLNNPAQSTAPYRVYNIGNNAPVDLMEFIQNIENELNKHAKKEYMPIQAGDVEATWADVADLIDEIGYEPKTTLKDGIKAFVTWFKTYKGINN